jgi:hypothetical protein
MESATSVQQAARLVVMVSSTWLLGACSSTPVPKEQMAVAEAAIEHASTSSTSDNAAGELQLAVAKLDAARAAMQSKDYVRARQLAEQAEVDAQVAELHAQSVRAGKAARESQAAESALRDELNRKTSP